MTRIARLLGIGMLVTTCAAQTAVTPRDFGDEHPLLHPLSTLSAPIQERILSAVTASMRRREEDDVDDDELNEDIRAVDAGLRWEAFGRPPHRILLVQATGLVGCGAVGNCMFFAFDDRGHVLLDDTTGLQFTLLSSTHDGLPDILLGAHISASEIDQVWYAFDGSRYRAIRCADDNYGLPYTDGKRHREFHSCSLQ